MDHERQRNAAGSARNTAAARRRRGAQIAAARARAEERPDSTRGSSSGGDSYSGSSPSVGLSGADDDAEEEEPRSAAPGAQRRGSKKPRTGASPPRPFLAALPLWRRVVGAGAPLRWSLSGCGLGIIVLMVAASPTRTLRPCAWQYTRNAQHLPKWWARSRAFLLRGSSRATVQRRFLRPTSTHSPNPTHPPTHPTNQ